MDIAYNGTWGYHPLVVSLANTGEVLSVVNRSGNRPSHEGAAAEVDRAIRVCPRGGFRSVLLRGDTDFSQTKHLDRWDDDARAVHLRRRRDGQPARPGRRFAGGGLATAEPPAALRGQDPAAAAGPRTSRNRSWSSAKFENLRLVSEKVAEFNYRPTACRQSYRLIVVRKNLSVEKGEQVLFADYRYFFYITNDRTQHGGRDRLPGQRPLQSGEPARATEARRAGPAAPVDNLESNWAYMVMTALAWNLKAWLALRLPEPPGRWAERHRIGKADGAADGVQDVRERLRAAAVPDHPHRPASWCIACCLGTRGSRSSSALLDVLRC